MTHKRTLQRCRAVTLAMTASCTTVEQSSPGGTITGVAAAERDHRHRRTTAAAADPKFGGVIKQGALESTPWWRPRVPPKGAPNVLLIITDDAGFGVPSTFAA